MKKPGFDDLKGRTCVITGGGGAIGSSLAEYLVTTGMNIVVLDLNKKRAEEVAAKIEDAGTGKSLGLEADVLDAASLNAAKERIHTGFGKVELLVNAAGGNAPKGTTESEFLESVTPEALQQSIFGLDMDGFRWVFELNLTGTLLPTIIFSRDMLDQGKGAVVNFSSMSALRSLTRVGAYSAAKAAVSNLTGWLAVHLAKMNIRVNAVAPGFFIGEQNRFLLYDQNTGELSPRGRKIIANTPMERFGEYNEIHGTVAFLLSDMAGFVTGVTIPIDGGFNAYSGV